ncbi:conjugal transfer protein TraX [Pseudomonas syringae]|uniref:conjugal transfer protein TraX n=1 Tax=Pseudomonas syringae TaxID=317 RepID=UPI0006E6D568|nr:conjugal transfer protein TraX [Pseudomonas syringae]KPY43973.1 TraX protein [Pseudomonas syringae pv. rhaphiolepidis]KWS32166.1 conjugal transfer protein TraX [Pseudomonas syringae pv. rhaphiolepidis]
MKTEPDTTKHVDEQSPLDDKHSGTPLRRAGHVGLSILNPFSDLAVIYRRGIKPTAQKLKLLKTLLTPASATTEADAVGVSWSVAVARSGRTIEQLLTSYNRIRAAWWCLMMFSASLSVLLLAMLLANFSLPLSTFLRATVTLLALGAIASLGFVKTLIATYRLWQLQNRRVSVAERGTFNDFLAETRWCRLVLTRGHLK